MADAEGATCNASILWGRYGKAPIRCAQSAGHYDGDRKPHLYTPSSDPAGWHRSAAPDIATWADWAAGATPHTPAAEKTAAAPAGPGPWKLEHQLHYINQIETRVSAVKDDGTQWAEQRLTGLATVVCNCGYTCGWAPLQQLIEDYPHVTKES